MALLLAQSLSGFDSTLLARAVERLVYEAIAGFARPRSAGADRGLALGVERLVYEAIAGLRDRGPRERIAILR
jgi:hypothetical protein